MAVESRFLIIGVGLKQIENANKAKNKLFCYFLTDRPKDGTEGVSTKEKNVIPRAIMGLFLCQQDHAERPTQSCDPYPTPNPSL